MCFSAWHFHAQCRRHEELLLSFKFSLSGEMGIYICGLNSFVHVIMYSWVLTRRFKNLKNETKFLIFFSQILLSKLVQDTQRSPQAHQADHHNYSAGTASADSWTQFSRSAARMRCYKAVCLPSCQWIDFNWIFCEVLRRQLPAQKQKGNQKRLGKGCTGNKEEQG